MGSFSYYLQGTRGELPQDIRTGRARNIFLVVNKNDEDDDNNAPIKNDREEKIPGADRS